MNEPLYEVKYFTGDTAGAFKIAGPDLGGLFQLVECELTEEERFGQPYDLYCLAANISGVNEDTAEGRIARPMSLEEFATAIVTEYRANLAVMSPELRRQLFACWSQ